MVKNETINNSLGSGLGLSICKTLAENMNMQISTKSIFGQGSEFFLEIPMKPEGASINNPKIQNIIESPRINRVHFKNELEQHEVLFYN